MRKPHALSYLVSRLLVDQLAEQFVSKGKSCSRSFTGGNIAIDGKKGASICSVVFCQRTLEAGITRSLLVLKDSQGSENDSGRGTDGSDLLAGSKLVNNSLADTLVCKVLSSTAHGRGVHE